MLLFARRAISTTAWNLCCNPNYSKSDVDDLCQYEFTRKTGIDLRPSVYEVDDTENDLIRVYAEHLAGPTKRTPHAPDGGQLVDLSHSMHNSSNVLKTPADSKFSFAKDAHRELVMADEKELKMLLFEVNQKLSTRMRYISKAQLHKYAKDKWTAGDSTWLDVYGSSTMWKDFIDQ